MYLLFRKT